MAVGHKPNIVPNDQAEEIDHRDSSYGMKCLLPIEQVYKLNLEVFWMPFQNFCQPTKWTA